MTTQNNASEIRITKGVKTTVYNNVYNVRLMGKTLIFDFVTDFAKTNVNVDLLDITSFSISDFS